MPQQTKLPLIKAEIAVLQAHLEDWRSVKGKQRYHILKAIHKEACLQAPTWDKALLKARKKTYKEWLYNQCHRKAPKPLIKYDKKWTARIQEETGEMPVSEAMIAKWPEATKTVLASLSTEEKAEANVLADKWNNEAAPPEVQDNLSETKGQDEGLCDLLDLEEDNDGLPMLPETMGLKRGEKQHVIRSFLTRHYRMCMGTEKVKAAVPWSDLIKNQSDFFNGTYWPADIQVVEPSKMDKASATTLLNFWYGQQQKKLCPTFCFKAWKDTDGDMEPPAKSYQKVIRQLSGRHNKAHNAPKAMEASKHLLESKKSLDEREEYPSSDDGEEAVISDHHRVPPVKSHQQVIHWISCRSKAHAVLEESLDEGEDDQSFSHDGEQVVMCNKDREQPPPALIIQSSTTSAAVARHAKEVAFLGGGICRR
ncbi:uncharacterized protein EDB93DRAFT_1256506 [Suillus bovinus]|uniref:uncharacterized protein n=1 Tax=Suillus bovinus TaxID=48563 RepID=UPI001B86DC37|nr:uncharacterized protein EDB93DRAFT_1256506 [Suillus bovinus]KAG2128919.1 hypothetical protein EDB93DRAFT_1256506 [Suillus bovinus]